MSLFFCLDLQRAKGSRAKNDGDDSEQGVSTWTAEKQRALDLMCKCLGLHLSKIWTATHEKESFISLFFKPSYQILENKENIKVSALKQRVYHVLCLCIKNHNHEFGKSEAVKIMIPLGKVGCMLIDSSNMFLTYMYT